MRKLLTLLILTLAFISPSKAQAPGCPDIVAQADVNLPCSTPCTNLTATPFHVGNTSTYTVASIPYTPLLPYNQPGGNTIVVGGDDVYSPVINLPFPFCYYGNTYTQCVVGSNGCITFNPALASGYCPWSFTANCPNAALPLNSIFGIYHDMYPGIAGTVKWHLIGAAPCRILVVNFDQVAQYSCTGNRTNCQMVLYETTNAIEVYTNAKPLCAWNGGRAIIGIQNATGATGLVAPNRNSTPTWTPPAAGEGWRFTPNGPAIYSVAWFQGATQIGTGNTINVCPVGASTTYTAQVTYTRCDGLVITDTDDVIVTQSTLPLPTVTPVAETCSGYNNGSVVINNAVGSGPYTVTITGPTNPAAVVEPNTAAGTASFTNLADGLYNYTVVAANGCQVTGTFTINPGPVCCSVTAVNTNVACAGGATGTATATPVGMPGFNYSWNSIPVQTSQTATNLPAGNYTVTLTDNSGCVATANVTVTQPTALAGNATPVPVTCFGTCNGSITVTAAGGTGALQYQLNGGAFQASNVFNGLCAGAYTVVVRDANNCTITINTSVTSPTALGVSVTANVPATCGANNGSLTVAGSGGTTAYQYSIGGAFQASGTFGGLAPGNYTITVQDANNCTATVTATIANQPGPAASVGALTNVTCAGGVNGSVTINASGGTGALTYDLNPGPSQASSTFNNLTQGAYTVVVSDANGCSTSVPFNITQPSQVTFTEVHTMVTCNAACNGTITVTANNGTPPYQYSSNGGLTFQASNVLSGICAGTINVVVRDANGCLINQNVVITQPAVLAATYTPTNPICQGICNGQINVATNTGGTAPYQFSANGGALQSSTNFPNLCGGNYTMLIQDANGCQATQVVALVDPPGYNIDTVFTSPSNCGFNDGDLEVVASGGVAPYQYNNITLGSGNMPSGLFNNLVAGAYEIVTTDALGCQETIFVGINDIQMSGVLNYVTDATCPGVCDGTASGIATGGSGTITYELSSTATSQFGSGDFTGICGGPNAIVMTDQGLCVYVVTFTVNEPATILYTTSVTNATCNGGATGTITFNPPSGGTAPYEYSTDGGVTFQASNVFNGLLAGTYNVVVRDANGCLSNNTATITEPTPVAYTFNSSDLTCFGNNTGTIMLAASGGTVGAGYQYSIDGGTTFSATFAYFGLSANTYNIVVRDGNGCTATGTITISEPAALAATYVSTATLCNGSCDGTIQVNASGGTTPYFYSSNAGTSYQTNSLLSSLCAGNYSLMVKDSNNCLIGSAQIVTEPTAVTYTTVIVPSTCGNPNGSITVNANGGTPTYTFSNDGGVTFVASNIFNGLAANTYNVDVQDANGCHATSQEVVPNQASPVINSLFATDLLCNAICNGQIDATATGGTGALTFDIGGAGQASGTFAALCAGNYTLTVTDANGCQDSQAVTLTEPTALTFNATPTNLLCNQDNTGEIDFVANGGVPVYLYSIDNGATFSTLTNANFLAAGVYDLVVEDANGCQTIAQTTITEPTALAISNQVSTNASCFGVCDGTVGVTITGGTTTGLYTYTWAGGVAGPNSSTANNLCAGSYFVDVTDDNGCLISTSFSITEPPVLVISNFSSTDPLCNGSCDGTIDIVSTNAIQYSVDNGATYQPGASFTNLCAGVYPLMVMDAAGCTNTSSVTLNDPAPLVLAAMAPITVCYGGFGTAPASATGGTAPYIYVWNTGDTTQLLNFTTTVPVSFTATAYDQNGCASNSETVTTSVLPVFVPSNSGDVTICPGEEATFTASGVDGVQNYYFLWFYGNDTLVDSPILTFQPTGPMTVQLITSDACPTIDTFYLQVNFYTPPQVNISPNPASGCAPLTVDFTNTTPAAQVGTNCDWVFGDGNTATGCGNQTNIYTTPGCYDVTLTVTSPEGCTNDSTFNDVVCVYGDPVADFTYNPTEPTVLNAIINMQDQSTNAAQWAWDFAGFGTSTQQNPTFDFGNDADTGQFLICLTVTSPEGCVDDTCMYVTIFDEFLTYVPNAFTPDGNGINDIFMPTVNGFDPLVFDFYVFDRWGELIFESHNPQVGWDGMYKNVASKQDVYVWKLRAKDAISGEERTYYGHVSLLR